MSSITYPRSLGLSLPSRQSEMSTPATYPSTDRRLPLYPTIGHNFVALMRWRIFAEGCTPRMTEIHHEPECMEKTGGYCNCIPEFREAGK
jgi:hypothetical protein